ncbi:transposase family protein [Coleofasciculus sp. FACHB-64]|nr:transposase family protein [Coleofasciculus sp. FACHB-64]
MRNAKDGSRGSRATLSIPDKILVTLQDWREYRTYFYIAIDGIIHEATAYRTVKRIEDILSKAEEFHLPGSSPVATIIFRN